MPEDNAAESFIMEENKMLPDKINICGIPYAIIACPDRFNSDCVHFGEIKWKQNEIWIAEDVAEDLQIQTLIHEWVHGVLFNTGFPEDVRQNEQLVQCLAMAIYQTFQIKGEQL